jgi:cytochrome oxidase Cu insertion factor (SCO1/SenC/PrrC family)
VTRASVGIRAAVAVGLLLAGVYAVEAAPRSIDELSVTLRDETGAPVRIGEWHGRRVVVAMGYTTCQRICPIFTLSIMRDLETRYRDTSPPLELAFVTLDPKADTPPVLLEYKRRQGLTSPHWHLLTGRRADVERVARTLGATFVDVDGHIRHDLKIVVFAPSGEVERVFDWDHRDVNQP